MKRTFSFLFTILACSQVFGQAQEGEVLLRGVSGAPELIELTETKVSAQEQEVDAFIKKQFKADENTEFQFIPNSDAAANGFKSEKKQQYYKGIKVEHGRLSTISKEGKLVKVVGKYVDVPNINPVPRMNEEQALKYALDHVGAEKYMWEQEEQEQMLQREQNSITASYYPMGELVIIEKDAPSANATPRLAYKFNIYALNPISRANYYVDAETGEIISIHILLKHVEGTAYTLYSGTRTIETEQVNGPYRLKDNTRGNGIHTLNMANATVVNGVISGATDLLDNDNNWTGFEHHNANKDAALLDAHWAAMKTYDYFLEEHGRNSLDNNGYALFNYVNADLTGFGLSNSDNAFWDGQKMVYGKGTNYNPLVSIDIVGHEIGHGLDENTSMLEYERESGAIDESLSDIWGAMIEFYAAPEKQTYALGEDIGSAFRFMADPKVKGDPDTYGGQNWWSPNCGTPTRNNDYCGVHRNSGIMNHWFFLLAEGSSYSDGINDNGHYFQIAGIGKTKASQIVYRAQTVYFMNPYLTFAGARAHTIQAAKDLFGINSPEAIQTCEAWYAVGVGDNQCIQYVQFGGPDQMCGTDVLTIPITNIPTGSIVNWSVNWNLIILSSTNSSITVRPRYSTTNGIGTITTVTDGIIVRKDIFIGKPSYTVPITYTASYGAANLKYGGTGLDFNKQGITSIQWQKVSGTGTMVLSYNSNNQPISATVHGPGGVSSWSFSGKVTITNACGTTVKFFNMSRTGTGGSGGNCPRCPDGGPIPFDATQPTDDPTSTTVNVYPNPVSTSLFWEFPAQTEWNITIYSFDGRVLQEHNTAQQKYEFDTSELANGVYFFEVQNGTTKHTKKIVVQH